MNRNICTQTLSQAPRCKENAAGNLLILLTAALWSFIGLAVKSLHLPTMALSALSCAGILSVTAPAALKGRFRVTPASVLGAALFYLTNLSFLYANQHTSVGNAIVLQECAPVYVLIFTCLHRRSLPTPRHLIPACACMAGMFIFFLDQLGAGNLAGNLAALFSGVCFGASFFLNSLPCGRPLDSSLLSNVFGLTAGLLFCALHPASRPQSLALCLPALAAALLFQGLPTLTYAAGIKRTNALSASMIALSEVILAPLWSMLLLHEQMSPRSLLGAAIMVGAVMAQTVMGR